MLIDIEMYFRAMDAELCGKWMPRKGTRCARRAGHGGDCLSPERMERAREVQRSRRDGRRVASPEDRKRWVRKSRLKAYGLSPERFDEILAAQGNACGMCREPFREGRRIHIDHDHACCESKKRCCGKCVRGLLCITCNITLGHMERREALARIYLDNPPAQAIVRTGKAA